MAGGPDWQLAMMATSLNYGFTPYALVLPDLDSCKLEKLIPFCFRLRPTAISMRSSNMMDARFTFTCPAVKDQTTDLACAPVGFGIWNLAHM